MGNKDFFLIPDDLTGCCKVKVAYGTRRQPSPKEGASAKVDRRRLGKIRD